MLWMVEICRVNNRRLKKKHNISAWPAHQTWKSTSALSIQVCPPANSQPHKVCSLCSSVTCPPQLQEEQDKRGLQGIKAEILVLSLSKQMCQRIGRNYGLLSKASQHTCSFSRGNHTLRCLNWVKCLNRLWQVDVWCCYSPLLSGIR